MTGAACENCGMRHEPDDKARCIEGHGDDDVQVSTEHTEADVILTDEGLACRLDWDSWPCTARRLADLHETQVTIHGRYGRGPMPVEFRDALVEMVRLVKRAIDDGTLPRRAERPTPSAGEGRETCARNAGSW